MDVLGGLALGAAVPAAAYLYWRKVWFFRNPPRTAPNEPGLVSPADGTVVYVKRAEPGAPVVSIKRGLAATIDDIAREHLEGEKLLVGVFMSPFDVHYNRAPLDGVVGCIRRHPGCGRNLAMGAMHWRCLRNNAPHYAESTHIVANERTVTRIDGAYRGRPLSCYVVQIAARTVAGIDSFLKPGHTVARGEIFGMIRIGSQVDLIVPTFPRMEVRIRPGQRVRAGETILVA